MKFTPKTEEEIQLGQLLPKREYMFSVKYAENTTSKKGNEMIKLTVAVYDDAGNGHMMFDYLLESMPSKLRHFCEVAELMEKYQLGTVDANDCINKGGVLLLDIEQKDDYPPRNVIKDYVKTKAINKEIKKQTNPDGLNDDIPF
jgi:hypothetical protein